MTDSATIATTSRHVSHRHHSRPRTPPAQHWLLTASLSAWLRSSNRRNCAEATPASAKLRRVCRTADPEGADDDPNVPSHSGRCSPGSSRRPLPRAALQAHARAARRDHGRQPVRAVPRRASEDPRQPAGARQGPLRRRGVGGAPRQGLQVPVGGRLPDPASRPEAHRPRFHRPVHAHAPRRHERPHRERHQGRHRALQPPVRDRPARSPATSSWPTCSGRRRTARSWATTSSTTS